MLHPDFLGQPIAHRGLHGPGRPENSMAAFRAAVEAGHGIELDVQPASDGTALVFHDYDLKRLAAADTPVAALSVADAASQRLLGTAEGIPTLAEVLDMVAGRVPVLVEIKDQDGALGPNIGGLALAVAEVAKRYAGPIAVMSFNPHMAEAVKNAAPELTVGLTSCEFPVKDWPEVPEDRRKSLAALEDFDRVGAEFISHYHLDLGNPAVTALAAKGAPILCWTIRSAEQEQAARRVAANITYEGYTPCAS